MKSFQSVITHITCLLLGVCLTLAILFIPLLSANDANAIRESNPVPKLMATADGISAESLTVDNLTNKISPMIQNQLVKSKSRILDSAGGPIAKMGVKIGYPLALREVPTVTEAGIHMVATEFGKYSIKDLIMFLENHVKESEEKGVMVDANAFKLLDELKILVNNNNKIININ